MQKQEAIDLILHLVKQARENTEGDRLGVTGTELAEAMGQVQLYARQRASIKALIRQGKIITGYESRLTIEGIPRRTFVYVFANTEDDLPANSE